MWAARYWARRYFAARYWAEVGFTAVVVGLPPGTPAASGRGLGPAARGSEPLPVGWGRRY